MQRLLEIAENAKALTPQRVKRDLFAFIKTLEEELAAYNRATLNQDSEDVEGKPIGFYSPGTEIITDGRKKAGEPFDLLEEGDFLDGLFSKLQGFNLFFDTTDPKKSKVLKNLLSENIFGLQDDDLNKVIEQRLAPFMIDYYTRKILE